MARRNAWDLQIDEVSGLGRRRNPTSGRTELLAVGDRETAIVTITADESGLLSTDGGHPQAADRHHVRGLPGHLDGSQGQSDWEGVAGDADGRIFILRETGSRVLIVSPTFEFERSVTLHWDHHEGNSLESLLLLSNGHLLSATQDRPLRILEFAPEGEGSVGSGRWDPLPADRAMPAPWGPEVHCLSSWTLASDKVHSANDLAISGDHLFLISSLSRCIARFRLPAHGSDVLELDMAWPLPEDLAPHHDDKAEGLVVDSTLGVLVGVDRRPGAHGPNLHELGESWTAQLSR